MDVAVVVQVTRRKQVVHLNRCWRRWSNVRPPCGSKDIAEATGLDNKVVSSQITALKKKGFVDSPVRCKYGITAEGKASLG